MKIDKINYYCTLFFGILFFLIPFALITGEFIPYILFLSIGFKFYIFNIYEKNFEIFKNKFFIFFIIYLFCCIISIILLMKIYHL